jgi:hypothetical protein
MGRFNHNPGIPARIVKCWKNIELRCNYPGTYGYERYGGRGIRNKIDVYDLEYLWVRDGASHLKQPSIDRIDVNADYTVDNCRFIEMGENVRRKSYPKSDEAISDVRKRMMALSICHQSLKLALKAAKTAGLIADLKLNKGGYYSTNSLTINGYDCAVSYTDKIFRKRFSRFASPSSDVHFMIAVRSRRLSQRQTFIIPVGVVRSVGRHFYIPIFKAQHRGPTPKVNWYRFRSAWHLLAAPKVKKEAA